MPVKPADDAIFTHAVAMVEAYGSVTAAASAIGITRTTLSSRLQEARRRGLCELSPAQKAAYKAAETRRAMAAAAAAPTRRPPVAMSPEASRELSPAQQAAYKAAATRRANAEAAGAPRSGAKGLDVQLREANGTISRLKKELTEATRRQGGDVAKMQRQLDDTVAELQRTRKAKFVIPTGKPQTATGEFCRVCIPDTHGCFLDVQAFAAFIHDLKALNPMEIVLLGDHLDCGGFLAQHHTLGYVSQAEYTFSDDVAAANAQLDEIQEAAPNAKIYYLEGNHEARIEKWIVTQVLRNGIDADYLYSMFGPETVLHLKERGIEYFRLSQKYHDLPVQGAIRLGKCHFVHGISIAANAAAVTLHHFGGSVVFGHTHRRDSASMTPIHTGEIGAWCPGCMCIKQPLWKHGAPTHWAHGYGLQLVREDGRFLHINVPIIEGESYMIPLTSALG